MTETADETTTPLCPDCRYVERVRAMGDSTEPAVMRGMACERHGGPLPATNREETR